MHRMQSGLASGLSSRSLILALVAAAVLALPAGATVVIKEKTESQGFGGFGNGSTVRTVTIAGDKSRSEDEFTYTGRFKTLAGSKPKLQVHITRLDKELLWEVNPDKQEYTEFTFEQWREQMAKMSEQMAKAQADMKRETDKHPDVEMTYAIDVKKTGEKQVINGFACEQVILTLTATPKDKTTGESADYTITMDNWMSLAVPGGTERDAFYHRFAEKLGQDPEMQRAASAAMASYGKGMAQLSAKLKDVKGTAVRSTMTIGTTMHLSPEHQAEMDKAKADADKQKAEAKKKDDESDGATSALKSGSVSGALGGFLGRKMAKSAAKKAEAGGDGSSESSSFKVVTEILSVSTTLDPGTSFDVPAGYKKIERKTK